ncbi:MAG: TIGR00730 family Rossman fold protein [Pseudomonadota bacterium]
MPHNQDTAHKRAIKAYRNQEFIEGPDARLIRILAEFIEPQVRFRKFHVSDTIVFFGSARVKPKDEALKDLEIAKANAESGTAAAQEQLAEAENLADMSRYYEEARDLAKRLTTWSKSLGKGNRRFIVCSGGGPGIMEAANRGAHDAEGMTVGFNISLPFEQEPNPYITSVLTFEFHYFFIRKYWFAYMAKALILFPGGFGTLDELFELLTLLQTKKITKRIPIVVYGTEYWKKVLNFDEIVRRGMISAEDSKLFHFCDTVDEAFEYLTTELMHLYSEQEVAR